MKKSQIVSKKLKIGILLFAGLVIASGVLAINPFVDIQYPVQELGNCQDKEECKQFCDNPENMEPCLEFAEKIGLMSGKEIERAKKMAKVSNEMPGPGGCIGGEECKAFCDEMENIRECIKFAEENDLILQEELEEAKKVIKAMDQGLTPPKCAGKDECDVYCGMPENMEECIEFGIAAGLMPEREQEEARKMLKALKAGIKPPKCAGKKECDVYCQKPENMEECMEFGIAAGFMPPQEVENTKKMLKALKAGIKPPNCQGDRECDEYCRKPENMEECMEFSIAAGFAPPGEEENMKRMLKAIKQGILPPDCRNDEECRVYCDKEENKQQCMDFSVAAGFMTEQEAEIMKKTGGKGPGGCMGEEECKAFCEKKENSIECIKFGVIMGDLSQEEADRMMRDMDIAEMGWDMKQGPGGCQTPEECEAYCQKPENKAECMGPQGPNGMMDPGDEEWPREDDEYLKQKLQEEYGDGWQKMYDEKIRQSQAMPPGTEQGPEQWREPIQDGQWREGPMPPSNGDWEEQLKRDFEQKFGENWEEQYKEEFKRQYDEMSSSQYIPEPWEQDRKEPHQEGMPQEQWNGEEGAFIEQPPEPWVMPSDSDDVVRSKPFENGDESFRFAPGEVNEKVFDIEQKFREGLAQEVEWQESSTEPWVEQPRYEEQREELHKLEEGQWIINKGQKPGDETRAEPGVELRDSDAFGEFKPMEPTQPMEKQPVREYEPISESNQQPMPQPTEPIYNIMPVPEPTYTEPEPAPEPPQGLLQPFKKFLGSIVESF